METTTLCFAPPPTGTSSTPIGDPAALDRLVRWGGTRLVHDLVHLLLTLTPERMTALRRGVMTGDAPRAEAAAHALGSSCGQLGGMRMRSLCMRAEALAGEGDLASVAALIGEIESELEALHAWLDASTPGLERVA